MMRRCYPHTSDPEILEAQRGAAIVKSIAAVAVVCAIMGLALLPLRDEQRTDGPRAGDQPVAVQAATRAADSPDRPASPAASDEPHQRAPDRTRSTTTAQPPSAERRGRGALAVVPAIPLCPRSALCPSNALSARWSPVHLQPFGCRSAAGQVMGDESCPYFAVDHASFATCDGARVARPAAVSFIAPAAARALKQLRGQGVLFIDVRSRVEAALRGTAVGIDYVVPYREAAHPLRWDSARAALALDPNPAFLIQVHAAVRAQGGGLATPVLLLCATGSRAAEAAEEMRRIGFTEVYVVAGGLDGSATAAGWRAAELPVLASADEDQLFGLAD